MNCPYCGTEVEEVESDGKYVNGIRRKRGNGCEFCNPTVPGTTRARKDFKEAPVAPPTTVRYKKNDNWCADPLTDAERFALACQSADELSKKIGEEVIVFKSPKGFYFTREKRYCGWEIKELYSTGEEEFPKGQKVIVGGRSAHNGSIGIVEGKSQIKGMVLVSLTTANRRFEKIPFMLGELQPITK